MKLIKLLYLADRRALICWGRPITFDCYFSMPHGPVLSFTLDKINQQPEEDPSSYWHQYVSGRQGYEVSLLDPAAVPADELSRAEEDLLAEVHREFGHLSRWDLRTYTHALAEWKDPQGSSVRIRISDILLAEGFSDSEVRDVIEGLRAEALAQQTLE